MNAPFVNHCGRCGAPMRQCACTGALLMATAASILPVILPVPPDPPKTTIARFRKFGEWSVCDICGLMMDYCRGHALPEFGTEPESSLKQRIDEAQKQ